LKEDAEMTDENGALDAPRSDHILDLERFLPYRLSVLSNKVSRAIARNYSERFNLSIHEWRVMAVLGLYPGISAVQVCEKTAMDKVQVSRAVASLQKKKHVERDTAQSDRRIFHLRLSKSGYEIYDQIIPLAQSFEKQLVSALNASEIAQLNALLAKLSEEAQTL
jgi:DNA-binding MarR family transcriptional regulator